MKERVTLKPGDYVSTAGMTEDQYHAVARAFMAAGCRQGEYPSVSEMRQYVHFGWLAKGRNVLFHGEAAGMKPKRHLTPAQVIGAVNAGNQQEEDSRAQYRAVRSPFFSDGSIVEVHEYDMDGSSLFRLVSGECRYNNADGMPGAWDSFNNMELISMNDNMTPCEKLGYKVGDRFVANGASQFSDGSIVELYRDDGSSLPLWKLISGHCKYRNADSKPGAYDPVKCFEKISESHTLTQTLREATEHDEKAKHHAAEHDRLMQRARDMLPDGWRLVRDGQPDVDMSDPANWREGDVIEWIEESGNFFTAGKRYTILAPENPEKDDFDVIDDDNDRHAWDFAPAGKSFRFHRRPT